MMVSVGVILLSGGIGTRMGAPIPKQYLEVDGKPIVSYSYELFSSLEFISEVVVVCEPCYQALFHPSPTVPLSFALPGVTRQVSVENGFRAFSSKYDFTLVHDGARPFITESKVVELIDIASECGAAVPGRRTVGTIKQLDEQMRVKKTLERDALWEMQTPQVLRSNWLAEGLEYHRKNNSSVTDDVALIEQFSYPIQVIEGDWFNKKITSPDDLEWANQWLTEGINREFFRRSRRSCNAFRSI